MQIGLNPRTDLPLATASTDTASQPMPHVHKAPHEVLDAWVGKLKHITLPQYVQVRDLLSNLSRGVVPAHDEIAAQAVFNTLIKTGEFEVFADVFEAYNNVQSDKCPRDEHGASSFKSSLTLRLPEGWSAPNGSSEELDKIFGRIRVDRLVVMSPSFDAQISADVCTCIASLLKSGNTTELVMHGALASPNVVAKAFTECKLKSIEFGGIEVPQALRNNVELQMKLGFGGSDLPFSMQRNVSIQLKGLANCTTLQHLTFHHTDCATFHEQLRSFKSPLESVRLLGTPHDFGTRTWSAHIRHVELFVDVVAAIKTLSVFVANETLMGINQLKSVFLERLSGHPSLFHLEINGPHINTSFVQELMAQPELFAFSVTCPALRHLQWGGASMLSESAGQVLNREGRNGRPNDIAILQALRMQANALTNPGFKLEHFALNGSPLWTTVSSSFFHLLKTNKTLQSVDYSGCYKDMSSTTILTDSLAVNDTLVSMRLPTDPSAYYMLATDGLHVHGFVSGSMPPLEDDEFESIGAIIGRRLLAEDEQGMGGRTRMEPLERIELPVTQHYYITERYAEEPVPQDTGAPVVPQIAASAKFEPVSFQLELADGIDPAEINTAQNRFESLEQHANSLAERLARRAIQKVETLETQNDLAHYVAHLMSAALKEHVPTAAVDGADYLHVAPQVLGYLQDDVDARSMRTIARLPEVNGFSRNASSTAPSQGFQSLIKLYNKDAVLRGLPTAPEEVNKVDANGCNVQLLAAVMAKDDLRVRVLIEMRAIDFGFRVAAFATTFEIVTALQSAVTVSTATMSTASRSITSTHLTTSTQTVWTTNATATTRTTSTMVDMPAAPSFAGGNSSAQKFQ